MIYRIIGESLAYSYDGEEWTRRTGPMAGAFLAGLAGGDGQPRPRKRIHPRSRFWFTEDGWRRYGRFALAEAMSNPEGRTWRLLREKNPKRSQVAYRDRWQVALLPEKSR